MHVAKTYRIRPAGRHLLTIGKDLIQDNYAAVIELVKNAYDADSHDVLIEFKKTSDQNGYCIVITDHGHGMSTENVINNWLVPSTQDKVKRQKSPSGRPLQGSKGVGRYAASILGNDLRLETVTNEGEKTQLFIKWDDFKNAEFLDDVDIHINTEKVSTSHGTRLTINMDEEHINDWNKKKFEKLQYELKKLKSPINDFLKSDDFTISLTVNNFPNNIGKIEETIEPYDLFDLFDYRISGKIFENGTMTLTYSSQKNTDLKESALEKDIGESTGCGELDIDIRVFDRDDNSIDLLIDRGLKHGSGRDLDKGQAKKLLDAYNGIGVYRNGFRIRPLGDPDFDWLELNRRRINTPSRCIGSNQVIGIVQIQSELESGLIEKSARDGLKENIAFELLKKVTMRAIIQLETLRYNSRRKQDQKRYTLEVERNLEGLFSFNELKQDVSKQLSKENIDEKTKNRVIERINKEAKVKNEKVEEIRRAVAIYQGQATLGKIINVLHHEGRHALNYLRNRIPLLRRMSESFKKNPIELNFDKILEIVNGIANNSDLLVSLFKRIDPLAAGRNRSKKAFYIKQPIKEAFYLFENELKRNDITFELLGDDAFKFLGWEQDIHIIFTNLILNSIYWISEINGQIRKVSIEIKSIGDSLVSIEYLDTGPGIDVADIESDVIFEPDYSTKPNGIGLGLAIAGEAAERNGLKLKAIESDSGAYFKLEPKTESKI